MNPSTSNFVAANRFAVAPMMDWTDRHCRYFHRLLTREALLYTEMIVADAILFGDREKLLAHHPAEHPLALQIGGSEPAKLAEAARIVEAAGFDEINLNVGCPSDRVQSGTFGACLMREPDLVGRCVAAMKSACSLPVTVKCRLGVDAQDIETALDALADAVWSSGCDRLWVHARKAWLNGLSPKQNREIPPLNHERVFRLKEENKNQFIGLNGGVKTLIQAADILRKCDGVMIGREAYQNPGVLRDVDRVVFGSNREPASFDDIRDAMVEYAQRHIAHGGRLNHVTRHMIGLFHGMPGARRYRQVLSEHCVQPDSDPNVIANAFVAVLPDGERDAA